ncbi:hypothetical protein D3C71_2140040 [compost metagenome]
MRRWRRKRGALILMISVPPSATNSNVATRIFLATRPLATAKKCWSVGSRSKALNALKKHNTPRWTISP